MRLDERYVTLTSEQDKKRQYYDEVVDCLEKTYASIGGVQSNSLKNLMEPDMMWKLVLRNGKVAAVTISKLVNGTRKVVLAGSDQSTQGKTDLKKIAQEDSTQKCRKAWAEVSGSMEHVYTRRGAQLIPDDIAAELMELLGKHIEPTGDGYHYIRRLGPNKEAHEKVIVGDIDQVKELIVNMKEKIPESREIRAAKKILESKGYRVAKTNESFTSDTDKGFGHTSLKIGDVCIYHFIDIHEDVPSETKEYYRSKDGAYCFICNDKLYQGMISIKFPSDLVNGDMMSAECYPEDLEKLGGK